MLVDESYVIDDVDVAKSELFENDSGIKLKRNNVDPNVIVDGVNVIHIVENSNETIQIDYGGYVSGRLVVEPEGVKKFCKKRLDTDDRVPVWIIDPDTVDPDNLPNWLPAGAEIEPSGTCDLCDSQVLVRDLFNPSESILDGTIEVVCSDCWDRRVPYISSEISTKDHISDDERIDIHVKIDSKIHLDTGGKLYTVRDFAGNAFDLKIWASEAESYDLQTGNWYYLDNALGDTYDNPMIDSNHGKLSVRQIEKIDPKKLRSRGGKQSKTEIEDGVEIDILAQVNTISEFNDGNILCSVTDREGDEFDLKIWADEGSKYDLSTDQWYYFVRAEGDTYDDPLIDSNSGDMVEIPVENTDEETIHL